MENGSGINLKDKDGLTPLMIASEIRDTALVNLLLKKGASIKERSNRGKTALHIAAQSNSEDIVTILLRHGADMNAMDLNHKTALTSRFVDLRVVEVLLEELALMKSQEKFICEENFEFLTPRTLTVWMRIFYDRLEELENMTKCHLTKELSVGDVIKSDRDWRKLMILINNEVFVSKFLVVIQYFPHYKTYLYHILFELARRRSIISWQEEKIRRSGFQAKYGLAAEIVQKISAFACEELFFDPLVPVLDDE